MKIPYLGEVLKHKPDNFTGISIAMKTEKDDKYRRRIYLRARHIRPVQAVIDSDNKKVLMDKHFYKIHALYNHVFYMPVTKPHDYYIFIKIELYKNDNVIGILQFVKKFEWHHIVDFDVLLMGALHLLNNYSHVRLLTRDKSFLDTIFFHEIKDSNMIEKAIKTTAGTNLDTTYHIRPGINVFIHTIFSVGEYINLLFYNEGEEKVAILKPYGYQRIYEGYPFILDKDEEDDDSIDSADVAFTYYLNAEVLRVNFLELCVISENNNVYKVFSWYTQPKKVPLLSWKDFTKSRKE